MVSLTVVVVTAGFEVEDELLLLLDALLELELDEEDAKELVDEEDDDGLLELVEVAYPELLLPFMRKCRSIPRIGRTYR